MGGGEDIINDNPNGIGSSSSQLHRLLQVSQCLHQQEEGQQQQQQQQQQKQKQGNNSSTKGRNTKKNASTTTAKATTIGANSCNNNNINANTPPLTLRQLVPVHRSLLQACCSVVSAEQNNNNQDADASSSTSQMNDDIKETAVPDDSNKTEKGDTWPNDTFLQKICGCSFQDVKLSLDILLRRNTSSSPVGAEVEVESPGLLLTMQYLLHSLRRQSIKDSHKDKGNEITVALSGLAQLVLPWVFSENKTTVADDWGDELLEAILDDIFLKQGEDDPQKDTIIIDVDESTLLLLDRCLEKLKSTKDDRKNKDWKIRSRILIRFHQWIQTLSTMVTETTQKRIQEAVIRTATDQIVLWMETSAAALTTTRIDIRDANNDSDDNASLLAGGENIELLSILLPQQQQKGRQVKRAAAAAALTKETLLHYDHVARIWMAVWKLYTTQDAKESSNAEVADTIDGASSNADVLLLITTVLCTILPQLVKVTLPVVLPPSPQTNSAEPAESPPLMIPVHQDLVWRLVYQCLDQSVCVQEKVSWLQESSQQKKQRVIAGGGTPGNRQLLRRRGLFLLRLLVEEKKGGRRQKGGNVAQEQSEVLSSWQKYVACFETAEMETEAHLIDQVWSTLKVLCAESSVTPTDTTVTDEIGSVQSVPALSWRWLEVLLARLVLSPEAPSIRKLSLYRLFKGQAGIVVVPTSPVSSSSSSTNNSKNKDQDDAPKSKKKKSKSSGNIGAPLRCLSTDFFLNVIVTSFDTLQSSVGLTMHFKEGNKVVQEDIVPLYQHFLDAYLQSMMFPLPLDDITANLKKFQDFVAGIWSPEIVCGLNRKSTVQLFDFVAWSISYHNKQEQQENGATVLSPIQIPVTQPMLENVIKSFKLLFQLGSVVLPYRESLLGSLACMLAHSTTQSLTSSGNKQFISIPPTMIIEVLSIFPFPDLSDSDIVSSSTWIDENPAFCALRQWLNRQGQNQQSSLVAESLAKAFVDGMLACSSNSNGRDSSDEAAEEMLNLGATESERVAAESIVLFSILVTSTSPNGRRGEKSIEKPAFSSSSAGELLWPAIHKALGLANVTSSTIVMPKKQRDYIARAIMLLENGCKVRVLSGSGNGELIADSSTNQIMPPPPSIEAMLANGVAFILYQVRTIMSFAQQKTANSGGTRSGDAHRLSSSFARLISQLVTLRESFPSSITMQESVKVVVQENMQALCGKENDSDDNANCHTIQVQRMALVYAGLTCTGGEETYSKDQILTYCKGLLELQFVDPKRSGDQKINVQALRSAFPLCKWGSLSCLLSSLRDNDNLPDDGQICSFVDDLIDQAVDAVEATPADALLPLFQCVISGTQCRFILKAHDKSNVKQDEGLQRIIEAFFGLLQDCKKTNQFMYMLDQICAVLFQPNLLIEEAMHFEKNEMCKLPIRDAFRRFIEMAGTERSQITRTVLARIIPVWLGGHVGAYNGEIAITSPTAGAGFAAIPYREDIACLLLHKEVHKEERLDESCVQRGSNGAAFHLPRSVHEASVVRAFVLLFLFKLAGRDSQGVQPVVLTRLVYYVMLRLLELIRQQDNGNKMVMTGTTEYCMKIRGWQALCVLSVFPTGEIAESVCHKAFNALEEPLHGQIRYFMEVFIIQCSRKHPQIYAKELTQRITAINLSLQQIASLMIIAGNLVVGQYSKDFLRSSDSEGTDSGDKEKLATIDLPLLLTGVIPWLSSTQGFSRAIAQLLVHKLIPLVADVEAGSTCSKDAHSAASLDDNNWYLRSLYEFLDKNVEMERLRNKQLQFFDSYDVDEVCEPIGVLKVAVDEGGEADPVHMVKAIKESLHQAQQEAEADNSPTWKRVEDILISKKGTGEDVEDADVDDSANFQRKIIPVDALNLALENERERRKRNASGRQRQPLIICATLIDKVPNLGGLARTAEIFAAERLVVPDTRLTKMDNFKSLSVGAGEWIDIEECKEESLFEWLREKKRQNYFIVGIEQTSSSLSIADFRFPDDGRPVVLLLGKEKEGIPVEYLQAVDQCLEIPQLGIIRSLNVHVAGALTIWEFTRQRLFPSK